MKKRSRENSMRKLLDAAVEVFSEHGPRAATIDEICRKAALNKRMVYHYFGSKEGLYERVLQEVYQQFLSLEVSLGSMLLPAEQLLEALVRSYYKFLGAHPEYVRLISYENLNHGKTARKLHLAGQKAPVITALQLALRKGQSDKRFRPGIDVTQLLVSIFSLCFFYFANRETMGQFLGGSSMGPGGAEGRIRHVVELLLHGIATDTIQLKPRRRRRTRGTDR